MAELGFTPLAFQRRVRGAYVHIPFCAAKCGYCDFNSYAGQESLRGAYVRALIEEIRLKSELAAATGRPQIPLDTLYFGGGTPSLLELDELEAILDAFRRYMPLAPDAELTFELNPGTVSADYFPRLHALGVNRLSMGLQAAQSRLLTKLGRIHSYEQFASMTEAATEAGFTNRSCDLMLGLPGQTLADVEETLRVLEPYDYPHLSVYSLIIEEGTPFARLYGEGGPGRSELPDEEAEREQHHFVRSYLADRGYTHYEISNYGRPGFFSRHNLLYWAAEPYYGFGAGAHSYIDGQRRGSLLQPAAYIRAMEELREAGEERRQALFGEAFPLEELISPEEARKELFLLGFRRLAGVSREEYRRRFGEPVPEVFEEKLHSLTARGLLCETEEGWRLTDLGDDLANQIFMEFV